MKSWKKILLGGLLSLFSLFLSVGGSDANEIRYPMREPLPTPEGRKVHPLAARLNDEAALAIRKVILRIGNAQEEMGEEIVSAATWRWSTAEQIGEIQVQVGEAIGRNASLLFEQLDRLGQVQEELGDLLRDRASLQFETAQEIESARIGLDEIITRGATLQIALSERIGKSQEEVGQAIQATLTFPPGTDEFGRAQERLGRAIRDNILLQRQAAAEVGENQERLGRAIRDQATFLISASEKLGRGEKDLGQTILRHARTLQAVNEVLGEGEERLGRVIQKGAQAEWKRVEQFGQLQERLGRAIQKDAVVHLWARGVMEEAVAKLILATEVDPAFALAHYNSSIAFLSRNRPGDLKNAIHHLERGLAVEPQNRTLLAFYAEIVEVG
jgi:tetratricopeptide (TPR) repeat protein